jgi:hypothetical protein
MAILITRKVAKLKCLWENINFPKAADNVNSLIIIKEARHDGSSL